MFANKITAYQNGALYNAQQQRLAPDFNGKYLTKLEKTSQ
jgi:hypothetical protein